jgi:hypothetical protein
MKEIIDVFEKHKGEFVLSHGKVFRLIGVLEDDIDYYWILFDGKKISYDSCVGKFTQLINKIDDNDYNEFIRLAKLNHWDLVYDEKESNMFKLAKEKSILDFEEHNIVGGLYWEIKKIT